MPLTDKIFYTIYPWFVSDLYIAATEKGVCQISFAATRSLQDFLANLQTLSTELIRDDNYFADIRAKLHRYFKGEPVRFDVAIDFLKGTEFQRLVWHGLQQIPYGSIITYGELARAIGRPRAVRAVGAANGANPVPILVPCHRVVASGGKLGGYSGGLHIKDALLRLEGIII